MPRRPCRRCVQFVGLSLEGGSLTFSVDSLLVTALLISGSLLKVELPTHGIDVESGPIGVEVEDLVDGGLH